MQLFRDLAGLLATAALLAVLIPTYTSNRERAQSAEQGSAMRTVALELENIARDAGSYAALPAREQVEQQVSELGPLLVVNYRTDTNGFCLEVSHADRPAEDTVTYNTQLGGLTNRGCNET
jgi:type II secretory pathway pseudopilin PulG